MQCILSRRARTSADDGFHHIPMHIREAIVAALESEGEPRVIQAELVEQRGVQIMNVDGIAGDVVAEVVGLAVHDAGPDAAAGHPHGEAATVVITAVIGRFEFALGVDGAAKFAAPHDERVLQHAALFQVADECGAGLIHVAALQAQVAGQVVVLVPAAVVELDEAHAALGMRRASRQFAEKLPGCRDSGP